MTSPGYQEGSAPMWWWKVALHLDEAHLALANAMVHNLDDQRPAFALQDRLREGQAILLKIFRAKGLLPGSTNGRIEPPMPGVPMPGVLPFPPSTGGEAAVPTTDVEQRPPLAAEEPAVPEAHQDAASSETEPPAAAPPAAAPAVVAPAVPAAITPEAPSADPGAGGPAGR